MPSFSATTATIRLAGGDTTFSPPRWSPAPARIHLIGGTPAFTVGTDANYSVTTPTLNTQNAMLPIGEVRDNMVYVTVQEQQRQQEMVDAITAAFEALTTQVGSNSSLIAQILANKALATAANDNATAVKASTSLASSYVDPTSVLTAASDGSIAIAAHTRVYGDGTRVSVNAGSVSGFASGDYVTVYYADAGRTGGAVTFQGTTAAVAQTGNTHVVGQATIPAAGQPAVNGTSPTAPGYTRPALDPGVSYQ